MVSRGRSSHRQEAAILVFDPLKADLHILPGYGGQLTKARPSPFSPAAMRANQRPNSFRLTRPAAASCRHLAAWSWDAKASLFWASKRRPPAKAHVDGGGREGPALIATRRKAKVLWPNLTISAASPSANDS